MNSNSKYLLSELSVFFPCYNESENIEKTVTSAITVLKKIAKQWEVIIVNDGSKDDTLGKAKSLQVKYPKNIIIIDHPKNLGYGGAFKSGLFKAKYQWITFTDSDGQFDFSELKKLITTQQKDQADVVVGYRLKRQDPKIRSLIAGMLKAWNFVWFGFHGIKDVDCAFKLFKKEAIDSVAPLKTQSAITTTELLIKLQKHGYKISQVGVHHYPRKFGSQTGSNFKVIKRAAVDSFNLWRALSA